jgi:hypothetical protein
MPEKFCIHCGAPTTEANFCSSCGRAFSNSDATPEMPERRGRNGTPAAAVETGGVATAVRAEPQVRIPDSIPLADSSATTGKPWLPYAICGAVIIGLLAAAAVVLIAVGGKPGHAGNVQAQRNRLTDVMLATRQLYVPTQQQSFSTLLPAGWEQVNQTNSALGAQVTVRSPVDSGAVITVGQVKRPAPTLAAEGARLLRSLSQLPAFQRDASTALKLAGGRDAWELAYQAGGQANAYYLLRSCGSTYAVRATVLPVRVSLLRQRIAIVAQTLQGNC